MAKVPNVDTVAAMQEAEEMSKHPENYKKYSSFSELLQETDCQCLISCPYHRSSGA